MHLPKVKHCLVCEDVRLELYKKATILGFYGITPDVEIKMRDFEKPIARLTFLLICHSDGKETYPVRVRPEIRDEAGTAVFSGGEAAMQIGPGRTSLVFGIGSIKLTSPGTYTFRVFVDSKPEYETQFVAQQGKAEDFAG